MHLDPTVDDAKKVAVSCRRAAKVCLAFCPSRLICFNTAVNTAELLCTQIDYCQDRSLLVKDTVNSIRLQLRVQPPAE